MDIVDVIEAKMVLIKGVGNPFKLGALGTVLFIIPWTLHAETAPYVKFTLGELFSNPSQNQSIMFDSSYWKTLVTDHDSISKLYGGVSAGLRIPFSAILEFEVGAGYYQAASFKRTGKVYQYNSSQFYNLDYNYKINIQRLILEGKLLSTFKTIYHPYLSAAAGASRNKSYGYRETPVQNYAVPDPAFADYSKNNFSYSVGIGVDIELTNKWRVGGGYEFSNFGTAKLGSSPVQFIPQPLESKTINTSQIMIQISYTI